MSRAIYRIGELAKHFTPYRTTRILISNMSVRVNDTRNTLLNGLMLVKSDAKPGEKQSIYNWVDPKDKSGEFKRQASQFRNFISNKPGSEFPAEKDRYHLCELATEYIVGYRLTLSRCIIRLSMGYDV